jgi:group I intron endonuclease
MAAGIYQIQNTENGKFYVGSAVSIKARWQGHKAQLRGGYHPNAFLQNAWNKYGEPAFTFSVLEETSREKLVETEQRYLDEIFQDSEMVYNISKSADCPMRGRKQSQSWVEYMSKVMTGRKRNLPDHKPMLGKTHSNETKKKLSEQRIGVPISANAVKTQFKKGVPSWNFGAKSECCQKGHQLTGDNLYLGVRKDGRIFRNCKTCAAKATQEYKSRKVG